MGPLGIASKKDRDPPMASSRTLCKQPTLPHSELISSTYWIIFAAFDAGNVR